MDASVMAAPVSFRPQRNRTAPVAVVGLGYVGLPTATALTTAGVPVIGLDVCAERLDAIAQRRVDLLPHDHERLAAALAEGPEALTLTGDPAALADAGAVLICVPTPVDEDQRPDLRALRSACAAVVEHARPGQTLVLTSTTYVGTTRELLVEPLTARGLVPGSEVHVAFAPERIDPGNAAHAQETVPRVLGGLTPQCARAAREVVGATASSVHEVSSLEAAELCKLYENTFRAVNIALANELADAARTLGADPIEVTHAAATKPYGYMPFLPGAGVGGHCIPCDPHYLLHSLPHGEAPVVRAAMRGISERPTAVAERAAEMLAAGGLPVDGARVAIAGVAYKPGVADVRESPALEVAAALQAAGAEVVMHDPLVEPDAPAPDPGDHDLAIVCTVHPGQDVAWLDATGRVLDATYRTPMGRTREVM